MNGFNLPAADNPVNISPSSPPCPCCGNPDFAAFPLPKRAENLHMAGVEFYRGIFKSRPVELEKIPKWAAERICWVAGGWGRCAAWTGLHNIERGFHNVFDHFGSSTDEYGRKTLVSEPYHAFDNPEMVANVHRIATALACSYRILPPQFSWWNPLSTCRIEFVACSHVAECEGKCTREAFKAIHKERKRLAQRRGGGVA